MDGIDASIRAGWLVGHRVVSVSATPWYSGPCLISSIWVGGTCDLLLTNGMWQRWRAVASANRLWMVLASVMPADSLSSWLRCSQLPHCELCCGGTHVAGNRRWLSANSQEATKSCHNQGLMRWDPGPSRHLACSLLTSRSVRRSYVMPRFLASRNWDNKCVLF